MKTALITGSFDPVTFGHLDIFHRAAEVFARVTIGVGNNPQKNYLFSIEERAAMVRANLKKPHIEVVPMGAGLTADYAYEHNAVLVKGVRMNSVDFSYEQMMKDINQAHQAGLETFVVPCDPKLHWISSSAAKEVCSLNGNTEAFVPLSVKDLMERRITGQLRVGLTGTIASGKSTLASALAARGANNGFEIHNIDLDALANDILFHRKEKAYVLLRAKIKDELGLVEWSRQSVGQRIFSDLDARKRFNRELEAPLRTRLRFALAGKKGVTLINGSLMIEAGWNKLVNNRFVLLDVDVQTQSERLLARGHSSQQIGHRIQRQSTTVAKETRLTEAIRADGCGALFKCETNAPIEPLTDAVYRQLRQWWENGS